MCFSSLRPLSRTANAAEIARSHWLQSCRGVGDGYVQVRCSCLTEGYACAFSRHAFLLIANIPLHPAVFFESLLDRRFFFLSCVILSRIKPLCRDAFDRTSDFSAKMTASVFVRTISLCTCSVYSLYAIL